MLDGQGRFSVCGRTTSADAAGLPASLGRRRQQPVRRAGRLRRPASAPPPSPPSTRTRASPSTCPGGAPFNITVTLKDAAGNPTVDDHPGRLLRVDVAVGAGHRAGVGRAGVHRPVEAHPVRDRAGGRARPERDDAGRAGRRRRLHRSQRHRDAAGRPERRDADPLGSAVDHRRRRARRQLPDRPRLRRALHRRDAARQRREHGRQRSPRRPSCACASPTPSTRAASAPASRSTSGSIRSRRC